MLELLVCSLLTIFPDYLYRRYAEGKMSVAPAAHCSVG
jgi:hypothetical protein